MPQSQGPTMNICFHRVLKRRRRDGRAVSSERGAMTLSASQTKRTAGYLSRVSTHRAHESLPQNGTQAADPLVRAKAGSIQFRHLETTALYLLEVERACWGENCRSVGRLNSTDNNR